MVVMTTISTAFEEVILRVVPSSMMTSSKVVETSVTPAKQQSFPGLLSTGQSD